MTLGTSTIPTPYITHDEQTLNLLQVYDATKIKNFMQCPRGYFFGRIIGLQNDEPNVHLEFGKAWAMAMYYMRLHKQKDFISYPAIPTQVEALRAFRASWEEAYPPEDLILNMNNVKNLTSGLEAIQQYAQQYSSDKFEVIAPEVLFAAAVDTEHVLYGRMDGVIRDEFGYWVHEDKTAQFIDWNRAPLKMDVWPQMWDYNFQIGAYSYALYMKYGPEAMGTIINALLMYSNRNEFMRIHSARNLDQLIDWQNEARVWISTMDLNLEMLAERKPSDRTLGTCYPRNGEYCGHYGCSFDGLCTIPNPLQHVKRWIEEYPPVGYKIEHWNPLREKGIEALEEPL